MPSQDLAYGYTTSVRQHGTNVAQHVYQAGGHGPLKRVCKSGMPPYALASETAAEVIEWLTPKIRGLTDHSSGSGSEQEK